MPNVVCSRVNEITAGKPVLPLTALSRNVRSKVPVKVRVYQILLASGGTNRKVKPESTAMPTKLSTIRLSRTSAVT